ncbi:nucleotidyltransferase family protein [Endozoicomonas sp.]|uniref:nucleotidyltransferase family protein n=1 Tax=Endozoicomonas sp. TaxID=1892382 RepID=UPI002887D25D|nr:nucleotidyltransferase domain-containing protein [Endozoicomonas sp.]
MNQLDIQPQHLQLLRDMLNHHLPGVQIRAYGSRVTGHSHPASDLDLVAFSSPQQEASVSALREALEESSLPFRVDFFVWSQVPESFQRNILQNYVIITEGTDSG